MRQYLSYDLRLRCVPLIVIDKRREATFAYHLTLWVKSKAGVHPELSATLLADLPNLQTLPTSAALTFWLSVNTTHYVC